jgi:HlyD family secretion protein
VLLDSPDAALRPGMSARAEILAATRSAALVVPIQAVVERKPLAAKPAEGQLPPSGAAETEEIKVVFAVESDKARQHPVTVGLTDETHAELTSGVEEGAVVINGPYRVLKNLKDGDAVKVSKEAEDGDTAEAKAKMETD